MGHTQKLNNNLTTRNKITLRNKNTSSNNTQNTLISAVIPTKNNERSIKECLNSLSKQSVPPTEVVVVDYGSTDDTKKVCRKHGCRVIDTGGGILSAKDTGINEAIGDVILNCDPVTTYPPTYVEKMTKPIITGGANATTGYLRSNEGEGVVNSLFNGIMGEDTSGPQVSRHANAFSKSVYNQVGGFNDEVLKKERTNGTSLDSVIEEELVLPKKISNIGNVKRVDVATESNPNVVKEGEELVKNISKEVPIPALVSTAGAIIAVASSSSSTISQAVAGAGIGFAAGEVGARIVGHNTVQETFTSRNGGFLSDSNEHDTDIHIHHDLVGLFVLGAGAFLDSPSATGAGAGLIFHHLITEGISIIGALVDSEDVGSEMDIPIDSEKNVFETIKLE